MGALFSTVGVTGPQMPLIDDNVLQVTAPLPYVPALAVNGILLGVQCLDGQQFEEGAVYTEEKMVELEQ
eukprot:2547686-Rhodomonas_salina.1